MEISVETRLYQDLTIEQIVREGGHEIRHMMHKLLDVGLTQALIDAGWTPPARSLQILKMNTDRQLNQAHIVCRSCGIIPSHVQMCCDGCVQSARKYLDTAMKGPAQ